MKKKLTVAIPTSDMPNKAYFFKRCLASLWNQSFQDFDIVITDNSEDDVIKKLCEWYRTGITYYKNPIKGMAQNTNEAIRRSTGELIKVLYMDDYLANDQVLEAIVEHFHGDWLITGADNNLYPYWTDNIETGNNKLGSPSALTVRNDKPLLFDEALTWLLDCDLYRRLYDKHGPPVILSGPHVKIGLHAGQATHTMGDERKLQEEIYMKKKYHG